MYGIFTYMNGCFLWFSCRYIYQSHGSYGLVKPKISEATDFCVQVGAIVALILPAPVILFDRRLVPRGTKP